MPFWKNDCDRGIQSVLVKNGKQTKYFNNSCRLEANERSIWHTRQV